MSDNKEKDTAAASTANPPPVEAIEEDDEFEEFEPCQWNKNEEDAEDSQQWQVSFWVLPVKLCRVYMIFCMIYLFIKGVEGSVAYLLTMTVCQVL